MWAPPKESSSSPTSASTRRASSSSASGPRRRRVGAIAGADLDARRARGVRHRHGGWEDGHALLDRRPEQPWVAAADLARIERAAQADDEDLPVTQRPGDLVRSGEQPAEAAGQGTERGGVGSPDEADRSPGRRAQGDARPTTASGGSGAC